VDFEVSDCGDLHAAVGQAPRCIVTISSKRVPLEGISLVVPRAPRRHGSTRMRPQ
jgi:hypothetical protein